LTDEELWLRLCEASGSEVGCIQAVARGEASFVLHPFGNIHLRPKVRFVDPDVMVEGQRKILSSIDPSWRQSLQDYLRSKAGEWRLQLQQGVAL
jgi:hypothetical protein